MDLKQNQTNSQGAITVTLLEEGKCDNTNESNEKIFDNFRGGRKLLTVNELASFLSVSPKTIYGWHYRGLIPAEKVGPWLIRFDAEKVMRWISNRKEIQHGY